ncbi:phosphate ABC transporter membrane protein 2, PhoT family [Alkalispirochaeta americana]|uniref:Phosphate transport system permease protein PstA n=1 Tax=Alkalispirochaeta americana TaxID=159291 RepID=A0A1N6U5V1_9SPIO|nr:phosphate ABC transporter permease PstA [Alkalispirochaeta americana]SIQ60983.1 phosphate ABC transporter membrane protein 2, PhoT family [Alkalispirochaeta americana]
MIGRVHRTRRRIIDLLHLVLMGTATTTIVVFLIWIVAYVITNGLGTISLSFIFSSERGIGIFPMVVTTLYIVIASLTIALPIGIVTAVYLNEYSDKPRVVHFVRTAIETLAGIPSILYGLFGLLVFARFFGLGQSILAGGLTLSIMILPVIIRTTEESLRTVPQAFREGSLALGTTQWQTIYRVVLPSALPGILTATILGIGRVVGEAAPVLLTVGIARNLPRSIFDSGRTLTIHLYYLTKEALNPEDFQIAFATASVLVIFVLVVNIITKTLTTYFRKNMER